MDTSHAFWREGSEGAPPRRRTEPRPRRPWARRAPLRRPTGSVRGPGSPPVGPSCRRPLACAVSHRSPPGPRPVRSGRPWAPSVDSVARAGSGGVATLASETAGAGPGGRAVGRWASSCATLGPGRPRGPNAGSASRCPAAAAAARDAGAGAGLGSHTWIQILVCPWYWCYCESPRPAVPWFLTRTALRVVGNTKSGGPQRAGAPTGNPVKFLFLLISLALEC